MLHWGLLQCCAIMCMCCQLVHVAVYIGFCNLMQLCWLDACGLHLSQCLCLTLSGRWICGKATKATLKKRALLPGTNSYFLTCWSFLLVHLLWCFVGSCFIVVLHHLCVWAPCMFWVLFSLIHVLWGPGYCINWLGMHAALSLWLGLAWPWCMCALNIIHVIVILGWKLD